MNSSIKLIDRAFGKGTYTADGENYQIRCPKCCKPGSTKKKLHISVEDLKYHCWVCGIKGKNILYLIKKLRPDIDVGKIKSTQKTAQGEEEAELKIFLPDKLVPVFRNTKDPDINAVRNYLIRRGFSKRDMYRWRVLSSSSGPMRRYAVFPSFDSVGNLNYYLGRSIDDQNIRYKNAKRKKSKIIFNEIDVDWNKTVHLVEGVFDAVKCPENTIPMLGSELPKTGKLYEKLVRNQCDVVVSLDPDSKLKAFKIADSLSAAGCSIRVCFANEEKDLGDMSKNEVLEILKRSSYHNKYNTLRHKIGVMRSGSIF